MSSILDALERASHDRVPGIADIPPETMPTADADQPAYRGLLVLGVVLITIVAILWFLFGSDEASKPESQPLAEQVSTAEAQPKAPSPIVSSDSVTARTSKPAVVPKGNLIVDRIRNSSQPNQRPLVSEAVLSHKQAQKKMSVLPKPEPAEPAQTGLKRPVEESTGAAPKQPASIAGQAASAEKSKQVITIPGVKNEQSASVVSAVDETTDAGRNDYRQIPLIWEMDRVLRHELEQLKTSIHVYSETPSQRFVIINMRRYSEGDTLGANGYRLHAIDRDGIVVDYGNGLVRLLREKL